MISQTELTDNDVVNYQSVNLDTDEVQIYIHGAETHDDYDNENTIINADDDDDDDDGDDKGVIIDEIDDVDHLLEYHTEAAAETLNLLLPETQPTAAVDCGNFMDFEEFNLCLNNMFSDDEVVTGLDVTLDHHANSTTTTTQKHDTQQQLIHFMDNNNRFGESESDSENSLSCNSIASCTGNTTTLTVAQTTTSTQATTTITANVADNNNSNVLDVLNCNTRNVVNIFQ